MADPKSDFIQSFEKTADQQLAQFGWPWHMKAYEEYLEDRWREIFAKARASMGHYDHICLGAAMLTLTRKYLHNAEEKRRLAGPINVPPAKKGMTAESRNIESYRKESNLTIDDLAAKVELSKKAVLDHINKGAIPRKATLVTYAQIFSNELGREVTVNDLQRE